MTEQGEIPFEGGQPFNQDSYDEGFEDGLKAVLCIRCSRHYGMPQLNQEEWGGGECGYCIHEEVIHLREKVRGLEMELRDLREANNDQRPHRDNARTQR